MSIPLETAVRYDGVPVEMDKAKEPVALSQAEDGALVAMARSGQMEAFEELVRRYRNEVHALSYHFVRQRETAWDLSQEVFIKAYKALARFRGDSSFKTWLMRITANQSKDYLKKRRVQTTVFEESLEKESPDGPRRPDTQLHQRELGEAIGRAVGELPPKHREAFVLREYEGLSYEEMAQVMGCSLGTVMSRLHYARKRLQNTLVRMGVVEEREHG